MYFALRYFELTLRWLYRLEGPVEVGRLRKRAIERGSTRKINKNTWEEKPSDSKNTVQSIDLQMFPDCSDDGEAR